MDAAPYGGLIVLADTSAWTNLRKPHAPQDARDEFQRALVLGNVRSSPVVRVELFNGSRDLSEIEAVEHTLSFARELPITERVTDAMFAGLREMAAGTHGGHKVKPGDALIAATAQESPVQAVLHYDHDFDRLANFFDFLSIWVAPRGSI
jgi:predicted nucleic acid-binding protein